MYYKNSYNNTHDLLINFLNVNFYVVGYVISLPRHPSSNAVWRFVLWRACSVMKIKGFYFEFECWNYHYDDKAIS